MSTFSTLRHILATPAAVFAAISDPVRLARWWGPDGFTNTFEICEFEAGGRWIFTMHGPNGAAYANESVFEEIVPDTLVRIRHVSPPHFVLTVALEPRGAGTLVTWEQVFADADVAERVRHIVEPSNEQNLDRLMVEVAG
ncbi:MAG: SRPBCC domain-containing protein [Rhodothermales bacterium]